VSFSGVRSWGAVVLAAAGFGLAGWWSARVGWADYWARQETVPGTEKALQVTPGQAEYYARLAVLVADSDPARADEALQRAVGLNPLDAESWIALGLSAESRGDNTHAQSYLLKASESDRKFLPRWTLANYYFRHNDIEHFWYWAKAAAVMVYGDATPLFRLCGRVAEDGRLMERLGVWDSDVQARYLSYLLGEQRVDLIGPVTGQLLHENREADVPLLLAACERLIEAKRGNEAIEIWNRLGKARRIPFGELKSPEQAALTNGNFAVSPTSRGFDWRLPTIEGISAAREENPTGLRLTFSGQEPENVEAVLQFVPVQEGREYRIHFRYRTSGLAPRTGLVWRIATVGGTNLAEGNSLSSDQEKEDEMVFRTPPGCGMVRIALGYRRSLGTTRIEGFIILREVRLQPV
jgi:tetratricopeptide (TPR) repeat protein